MSPAAGTSAEDRGVDRRELLVSLVTAVAGLATTSVVWSRQQGASTTMYGLIGKATAVAGKRDELIAILLAGVSGMPGCLSYVVAKDPTDENAIWITEVWDSQESHTASLSLPSVREAIAQGRPLIASFGDGVVTEPVGGHGLVPAP